MYAIVGSSLNALFLWCRAAVGWPSLRAWPARALESRTGIRILDVLVTTLQENASDKETASSQEAISYAP